MTLSSDSDHYPDTAAFAEPTDVSRAASESGDLVPVVFLPGLLCDQTLWRPQINALADVVAPIVADVTLDNSVTAMAARVLRAAPARFALVGLSMGGYVALEIMRQAPERISRLALFSTSAGIDSDARRKERHQAMASLGHGRFVGVTRRLLDQLIHPRHLDGPVEHALRHMAQRVGGAAFLRQQEAIMSRTATLDLLGRFRLPTLVAVGTHDRVTPPAEAEAIAQRIPGAHLHRIDACGHLPALESPEETAALLRAWLAA